MYEALMSCLNLLCLLPVWQWTKCNWTMKSGFKIKFHSKLPFVPTPPLPHSDLVFQAELKLAGPRAGRSPSNLCCYYSRADWEQLRVLHHMVSHLFHFVAAVLVMVNQCQPDINLKKLIFMAWTSFTASGLHSKTTSFLISKFVFIALLQTCDTSSLQSCYWDCRYVAGRRWVLLISKYERRQTDGEKEHGGPQDVTHVLLYNQGI